MAYTTREAIEAEIGEAVLTALADLDNDGTEDAGVVDGAIRGADALINSYANKRYAVPLTVGLDVVTEHALQLAIYNLRRKKQALTALDITTHADDIQWLKDLAEGKVTLGVEPQPPKSSLMRDAATPRPTWKDVSRDKLKGF